MNTQGPVTSAFIAAVREQLAMDEQITELESPLEARWLKVTPLLLDALESHAALVSDLAAFVTRVAGEAPISWTGDCGWCEKSATSHDDECPYTQATQLAERITAAGLSVDSGHAGESKGE